MLAIHNEPGSFSDRWGAYCRERDVPHRLVNLYSGGILRELRDSGVRGLLFHINEHASHRTQLAVRPVCLSAEKMGIRVFPSFDNYWHCDDKVAQTYLFEALGIPMCRTSVFYDENEALAWIETAEFPQVFKLRNGSASTNVRLVKTRAEARSLAGTMFRNGLDSSPRLFKDVKTKISKHNRARNWPAVIKRLPQTLARLRRWKSTRHREQGYLYFQEYLPGNDFDTRVTIIGDRAFAFRRFARPDDFRASGSGRIDWAQDAIDTNLIRLGFEAARKMGSQSLALDFVYDKAGNPVVLETCYCYDAAAVHSCPGHWNPALDYCRGQIWPQDAIIADLIQDLSRDSLSD